MPITVGSACSLGHMTESQTSTADICHEVTTVTLLARTISRSRFVWFPRPNPYRSSVSGSSTSRAVTTARAYICSKVGVAPGRPATRSLADMASVVASRGDGIAVLVEDVMARDASVSLLDALPVTVARACARDGRVHVVGPRLRARATCRRCNASGGAVRPRTRLAKCCAPPCSATSRSS